jgi:DEAD/DEAH box helicase domain-containing protein
VLDDLVARRVLRRRPTGWYVGGHGDPAGDVDLRGGGGSQVAVVEAATGRLLGTVDQARAPAAVHPGAVHLHRGESYLVEDLDLAEGVALVRAETPGWTTVARSVSTVEILDEDRARDLPGGLRLCAGRVRVTGQVVGYLRRLPGGELMDLMPLDMPEQALESRGVWYTVPERVLISGGVAAPLLPGALHAAEHAAIGLLPLFAGCDRSDVGGLSTACHPDTGEPTVIVHDGYPGGAGFADRGFDVAGQWLTAVRRAVAGCGCASGCPSCVQSPKCGNGNHPLDKAGAVKVLQLLVDALTG